MKVNQPLMVLQTTQGRWGQATTVEWMAFAKPPWRPPNGGRVTLNWALNNLGEGSENKWDGVATDGRKMPVKAELSTI